jgi:hypothetical protein
MTEKKKPEYTIDMGLLDWTPEERRKARQIVKQRKTTTGENQDENPKTTNLECRHA